MIDFWRPKSISGPGCGHLAWGGSEIDLCKMCNESWPCRECGVSTKWPSLYEYEESIKRLSNTSKLLENNPFSHKGWLCAKHTEEALIQRKNDSIL